MSDESSPTVTASWLFDEKAIGTALRWHQQKQRWLGLGLAIFGALLFSGGVFVFIQTGEISPTSWFSTFFGLYFVLRPWITTIRFLRAVRRHTQYAKVFKAEFSTEGFRILGDGVDSKVAWKVLYGSATTPDGFLLYLQKGLFNWVPRNAFESSADANFLDTQLKLQTHNERLGGGELGAS